MIERSFFFLSTLYFGGRYVTFNFFATFPRAKKKKIIKDIQTFLRSFFLSLFISRSGTL
jgi:hypothetical protein